MLHEILLSLSGHPSPLLRSASNTKSGSGEGLSSSAAASAGLTPSELDLLASIAHLSDLHVQTAAASAQISTSHPSAVCRAVAAAVNSIHLAAFRRKVLDVEASILRDDPDLVGAYNIVPLTAIIGEFRPWMRRMEWLWATVRFISGEGEAQKIASKGSHVAPVHAARVMNHLRSELQSGYRDVEETALSLVAVAEKAWLKQVSAWILYGRLPSFGGNDFFIQTTQREDDEESFKCVLALLPSFVMPRTASSMLFIGKSLNHVRVRSTIDSGLQGLDHLSSKLQELSSLTFPLDSASFSRAVTSIRLSLSERTLQKILPLSKVVETLQLLRAFFLLGRGEFAMALTHEADERIRNRWRRADNLAYEKGGDGLKNVTVKDGEVAAVLGRTWSALASMQGQHGDEDEQLELARDLLRLYITKPNSKPPLPPGPGLSREAADLLHSSPFSDLLFSTPTKLSIQLPSPLDMVLSPSDLTIYSCINAYLLSMRRAHIRLTDLWKITSLRRHHPASRGADEQTVELRQRWTTRMSSMRSSWTTASAAIFFLAETEAYLQTEIVAGLWDGFHAWLTAGSGGLNDHRDDDVAPPSDATRQGSGVQPIQEQEHISSDEKSDKSEGSEAEEEEEDVLLSANEDSSLAANTAGRPHTTHQQRHLDLKSIPKAKHNYPSPRHPPHDPQTISAAHTLYLHTLVHRLLLTQPSLTKPLHELLVHIDHLVAHTHRLHAIFTAIDLETDAGVVDAFVDLAAEEVQVTALLRGVERKVKHGIGLVLDALRALEADAAFVATWEGEGFRGDPSDLDGESEEHNGARLLLVDEGVGYTPARVGGVNRLLMKLDFGAWFGKRND